MSEPRPRIGADTLTILRPYRAASFASLPIELLMEIFSYQKPPFVQHSLSLVSKRWHKAASSFMGTLHLSRLPEKLDAGAVRRLANVRRVLHYCTLAVPAGVAQHIPLPLQKLTVKGVPLEGTDCTCAAVAPLSARSLKLGVGALEGHDEGLLSVLRASVDHVQRLTLRLRLPDTPVQSCAALGVALACGGRRFSALTDLRITVFCADQATDGDFAKLFLRDAVDAARLLSLRLHAAVSFRDLVPALHLPALTSLDLCNHSMLRNDDLPALHQCLPSVRNLTACLANDALVAASAEPHLASMLVGLHMLPEHNHDNIGAVLMRLTRLTMLYPTNWAPRHRSRLLTVLPRLHSVAPTALRYATMYSSVRRLSLSATHLPRNMPPAVTFPHLTDLSWAPLDYLTRHPRLPIGDMSLAHAFDVLANMIRASPVLRRVDFGHTPPTQSPHEDLTALRRLLHVASQHPTLYRLMLPLEGHPALQACFNQYRHQLHGYR